MLWTASAERRWQELLTDRGLMPSGPDSPVSALRQPTSFFRRRWAYLEVAYPHAVRTSDEEVETWRMRRTRRRRLFVAWIFGGLAFAVATIVTIEVGQRNVLWLIALVPIAVALSYLGRRAYAYGNARYDT
jgi:hypothetical protein